MALAPRVTLVRGRVRFRVRLGWGLAFSPWATDHPAIETGRVGIVGLAATNYGYTMAIPAAASRAGGPVASWRVAPPVLGRLVRVRLRVRVRVRVGVRATARARV